MAAQFDIGDVAVDVVFKDIKNLHLSVYPPTGAVRIAAPYRMNLDTIRVYAISKLDWIRRHQRRQRAQARETPREYIERESHYVWGRRYLLHIVEADAAPKVTLSHRRLVLQVRPGTGVGKRREIMEAWYRTLLKRSVAPLIAKWEKELGVSVGRVFVQRMKTKWGSCSPGVGSVRLNTDLAKKHPEYLGYILVHEMAHLLVRSHNDQFRRLLDRHVPQWKLLQQGLNRSMLSYVDWELELEL